MENKKESVDVEALRPSYCVWELTLACNLRCGHCGSRAGKARSDEMTTDECLAVVKSLAGLGCEVITLSGGEPTLRQDWHTIASAIHDHGILANMVTNAYALDRVLAQRMRDAHLANIAVSIDGPEQVHDRIRGKGTFKKTTQAVQTLKEVGMPVTVMTTINRLNLPVLQETYDVAVKLGADRFRTQLGKPMGNLKDHDDWVIKPKDLLKLLPILCDLNERGPINVGIGDSIGYFGPYDSQLRYWSWKGTPQCWAGCQAGLRAIGVESNGGIKGCLSMQAFGGESDPFLEGNIRERPLEAIWSDPNAFAYNRRFSPEQLSGYCGRCQHRISCRGGAKCMAAAACGGVGEDPYCYHRVAAMATRWPTGPTGVVSKIQTATTATMVSLLLHGCNVPVERQNEQNKQPIVNCEVVDCSTFCGAPSDETLAACCEPAACLEYGVEPVDCSNVDCCDQCNPLPEDVAAACCEAAICAEYGVEPCTPVDCNSVDCCDPCAQIPEDIATQCCPPETMATCVSADYGSEPPICPVNCEDVNCCDQCNPIPEDVAAACCEAAICAEYGVEPCPPIDCQNVCCACEYGVLPPEVAQACCEPQPIDCETVCCDCDYGILPPEVAQACCEPQPIDCETVCCDCDYGILPPEVAQACCEPPPVNCDNVCCDCDYGDLPPPECCDDRK
ncbi:MAG: hypothetical protein A2289_20705 [Deltaproteobacteria bacterium RIFOXYA12_FULL_58_15]|nr:MAG: hypothetical protein A2289_20705 [Deltaproteobacteria bacterium RIFOXYA12_FULL_58_15]